MQIFTCQNCGQLLHFENIVCMRCGMTLGFLPEPLTLSALELRGDRWIARADGGEWRQCANLAQARCNWMVPVDDDDLLPVLRAQPHHPRPRRPRQPRALAGARGREAAAGLRADAARPAAREPSGETGQGLAFDFLADAEPRPAGADRPRRRAHHHQHRRGQLGRARAAAGRARRALPHAARPPAPRGRPLLLGRAGPRRRQDRRVPRDLRRRERRLRRGAAAALPDAARRPTGTSSYVSAYATMHPWEDFAETWTHYLHMVDTLDTAASFGLAVDPVISAGRLGGDRASIPTGRATSTGWSRPGSR